jgi:FKBP12-rapamycin complex-associated protein
MNVFEANGYSRSDALAVNSYSMSSALVGTLSWPAVVPAVRGLFHSIRAQDSPEKMIKALLRLVTIWFRYGESESVLIEVEAQLVNTPTKAWLMAIPQLIARLGTQHKELQGLLIDLLKNIASRFPHAIIWPLFTASQTNKFEHQEAARDIMNYICTMSDGTRLVSQAQLVGRELIRASLSLIERWVAVGYGIRQK